MISPTSRAKPTELQQTHGEDHDQRLDPAQSDIGKNDKEEKHRYIA
jgi:hypothetical protein